MKNKFLILLILCGGLILSGCQTTTTYYQGAKADAVGVVSLVPVPVGQQKWQDLYVTVDYNLNRSGDNLDIDGVLSFSDSPQITYSVVRDLKLKLFLLDQDMRVVDYFDVARTLSHRLDDETTFSQTMKMRPGVVAMTFGYEGAFTENDPEGPSGQTVWRLPKRATN
ncbi:hypothetical protein [uncultured Desulfuromusa sp.]|uniref:hypothetical protein n=1 Tax=uncultured Desulfuromusa sp. TaxID=219183 RepID=UPI002AA8BD0E|nr:hypothetical protein [uncultured Desulfuromusa sp.]